MKRLSKIVAIVLILSMIVSMIPTSYAEDVPIENQENQLPESLLFQAIDLSSDEIAQLTPEELEHYQQLLEQIQAEDTPDSLTIENEDVTMVYSVKDPTDEDNGTVLEEYTYIQDDTNTVYLTSYSEITISGNDLGTEDLDMSDPMVEDPVDDAYVEQQTDMDLTDESYGVPSEGLSDDVSDPYEPMDMGSEETTQPVNDDAESSEPVQDDGTIYYSETGTEENGDIEEKNSINTTSNDEIQPELYDLGNNDETTVVSEGIATGNIAEIPGANLLNPEGKTLEIEQNNVIVESTVESLAEAFPGASMLNSEDETLDTEQNDVINAPSDNEGDEFAYSAYEEKTTSLVTASESEENHEVGVASEKSVAGDSVTANVYNSTEEVRVTAEQLLKLIQGGDEMAISFAESMGFGFKPADQIDNLTKIVEEYKSNPDFVEPAFIIKDVKLSLDKDIKEDKQEDESGYKTTVNVDSSATVEIVYDDRGEAKVVRKVKTDKATDFLITLDVSGSMAENGRGRDNAMFSALKVVLDEILQTPENTVSIIFWSNNAAVMRLDINEDGISETTFSGADGYTADLIYDSNMISEAGAVSDFVLSESYNVIYKIEDFYQTSSSTEPDKGLDQAIALLEAVGHSEDRNLGVMLFTDGEADYTSNERRTVANEKALAETYGAKIVNVSIGSENQVKKYERYLDPNSENYYEPNNELLQERVLYYNIPNLTNEELAERVTEMFDVAFEDITTETHELKSETLTKGILAAVAAKVIETVPAGFRVVVSDGLEYTVEGTDENGNTIISFKLDDLISQNGESLSYFVVPADAEHDIGITAYTAAAGTTLYAEPVDKILVPKDQRGVQVIYQSEVSDNNSVQQIDSELLRKAAEQRINNIMNGQPTITSQSVEQAKKKAEEAMADEDEYKNILRHIVSHNITNPFTHYQYASELKRIMTTRYKDAHFSDTEIKWIIDTLANADEKYRMIYLCSFYEYKLDGQAENPTSQYRRNDNILWMSKTRTSATNSVDFPGTFFHESGHACQLRLWMENAKTIEEYFESSPNKEIEKKIQQYLFDDVKDRLTSKINEMKTPSGEALKYLVIVLNTLNRNVSSNDIDSLNQILDNLDTAVENWESGQADQSSVLSTLTQFRQQLRQVFPTGVPDRLLLNSDEKQKIVDAFFSAEWGGEEGEIVPESLADDVLLTAYYKYLKMAYKSANNLPNWRNPNANMTPDISGGTTNHKMGYAVGHSKKTYWYQNGKPNNAQLQEAWAEYFSAKINKDQTSIKCNEEFFPKSTVELENLATALYDYYTGLYK